MMSLLSFTRIAWGAVEVKEQADRVRVEIDGKLFTELRFTGAARPYYWPLIGPGEVKMTRAWPMEEPPGEQHDHPHHRSMWFGHGVVNGVDFWTDPAATEAEAHPVGKILHEKIIEAKSGAEFGTIKSAQKWVAPDGSQPVTSTQTLRVYERPASERLFDFEITLTAGGKDVVFGDSKEGAAAIRIAETMRLKGANGPGQGHIVNSEGDADDQAWGKRAKWVDMSGPVGGHTLGIAFMDHPKNPRHPTRWHARDYGLVAANPFCEVEMDKNQPKGAGDFTLKAGQSIAFKYRILIHEGDAAAAQVKDRYAEFIKP
jgi:Methane oxygenase PmoA